MKASGVAESGVATAFYHTEAFLCPSIRELFGLSGELIGWRMRLPDGTLYEMDHHVTIGSDWLPNVHGWYTTKIKSPVEPTQNWVVVQYDDPPLTACIKEITDSVGRVIHFTNAGSVDGVTIDGGVTTSVQVPAFGATTNLATYTFGYSINDVSRPEIPLTEQDELFLTSVTLPVAGYAMRFSYSDPVTGANKGPIRSATLELGSSIPSHRVEILYDYHAIRPDTDSGDLGYFQQAVNRKELKSAEGQSYVWTYNRSKDRDGAGFKFIVRTDVSDPYGNTTRYDFTGQRAEGEVCTPDPSAFLGDLCGYETGPTGLLRKLKHYQGAAQEGNLLRKEERGYGWYSNLAPRYGWAVRLFERRIIFADDGDAEILTTYSWFERALLAEKSEYHLRRPGQGPEQLYRRTLTNYSMPAVGSTRWTNWVINTPTATEVLDAAGISLRRSHLSFADDGRLLSRRDLILPPNESISGDVVTSYEVYDTVGNATLVSVSDSGNPPPVRNVYRTYQHGYQAAEQIEGFTWKSLDIVVDRNTGLPSVSKDPAGIATSVSVH